MLQPDDNNSFTFAMGEHTATFPFDRLYASNHMWAKGIDHGSGLVWRFGLTEYAVRLLQDVYFLDWLVEPGNPVKQRGQMGSIESKKAESDLYAPIAGSVFSINEIVLDDPSLINAYAYGDGWMFELKPEDESPEQLLRPNDYATHLEEAWKVAQRTIKGQANH